MADGGAIRTKLSSSRNDSTVHYPILVKLGVQVRYGSRRCLKQQEVERSRQHGHCFEFPFPGHISAVEKIHVQNLMYGYKIGSRLPRHPTI